MIVYITVKYISGTLIIVRNIMTRILINVGKLNCPDCRMNLVILDLSHRLTNFAYR